MIDTAALDRAVRRFPRLLRIARTGEAYELFHAVLRDIRAIIAEYRRIVAKELAA